MPTKPNKTNDQKQPDEAPAQRDSRILMDNQKRLAEIQATLRQITDHLRITKKLMGAIDPSAIRPNKPGPFEVEVERLPPPDRLTDSDF